MARKKDQAARRKQLVSATIELIADRGIEALTLAAIADRAGVSHRLVAYYYADLESLVHEAHGAAAERYYWARLQALDQVAGPEQRLLQLIRSGLPRQQDRRLSQVLNELSVSASRSLVHARLVSQLFDREVSLYRSVLQDGEAAGAFRLSQPDPGPQLRRPGGRLRFPPAGQGLPGRRGRRAGRAHRVCPDRHRRHAAQPRVTGPAAGCPHPRAVKAIRASSRSGPCGRRS